MKRAALVATLENVGRALADNNMVPMFNCFCFTGKTVYAFNDAMGIIAPCATKIAFASDGKTMLGLLSNCRAEDVEFQLNGPDVIIKAGRSTFKLPYFNDQEFIFEEPKIKTSPILTLTEELNKGVAACLETASKDNAHPALMGVCINQQRKNVTLYACDGDAVSRFTTAAAATPKDPELQYMLPNAFCEALLKLCPEGGGKLYVDEGWAKASLENGYVIYGRLIEDNKRLDHALLIKQTLKGAPEYLPVPPGLDDALSRARVVADPSSAKTVLTVEAGKLKLLTSTQVGEVRDTIPLAGHSDVIASVSAALVQRTLAICDEIAILGNCTVHRQGSALLVLISNMGD